MKGCSHRNPSSYFAKLYEFSKHQLNIKMNAHRNRPTSIASLREAGTDVNLPI
jgi:hypothetical protein